MTKDNHQDLIAEFVSRGLVILPPDDLGVPASVHRSIYEKERAAFSDKILISASTIPEILQVLNSPGVVKVCDEIIGEGWAIVPFTHNAPFVSGSHDQHWHKDDNGPFNGRRPRYHHPIQIEMLYYPQAVGPLMGPTATIPFSQYWTFNHEENNDNFAGADHLDFQYQIDGTEKIPVSGPKTEYSQEDILEKRTDHDLRLREAVENIGWPFIEPYEVSPLEAGSVVLYSHNLFHRGNHRRDSFSNWKANPRFMWRFWLYRTTKVEEKKRMEAKRPLVSGIDSLTKQDLSSAGEDLHAIWKYHYRWLTTGQNINDALVSHDALSEQLFLLGDKNEPKRLGAAYRLARSRDRKRSLSILERAINLEIESVRRAATYGLIAVGDEATDIFLTASQSSKKWVRKAGAFGLGETGRLDQKTVEALTGLLKNESSIHVRSVAAIGLGSFVRRAGASKELTSFNLKVVEALLRSLHVEDNRQSMDQAQGRDIKFVRPTDECDVCEGIGINYNQNRFALVRSAVRENSLWSLVVVCSQKFLDLDPVLESLIEGLTMVVESDDNVFSVGLAADALNRLIRRKHGSNHKSLLESTELSLFSVLTQLPIRPIDSLSRSGYPSEKIDRLIV